MEGDISGRIAFLFASPESAGTNVAGLPAAARLAHAAAEIGFDRTLIVVPGGWSPPPGVRAEIERLAPGLEIGFCDRDALGTLATGDLVVAGESALAAGSVRDAIRSGPDGLTDAAIRGLLAEGRAASLAAASRRIVKATTKPDDGVVSRTINRPISQAMSALLLRWPGIRPGHGTILTALTGLAMIAALIFGGKHGLVAGALLFQLASIVDGVDGEIARATFRASPQGARLDSLIDAATNLAVLAGLSWNVARLGDASAALAGMLTLVLVATGLTVLARSRKRGAGLHFDALKHRLNARPSALRKWLIWLTMRDFLALLIALMAIAGMTHLLLIGFAMVAAGWLVVVVATMTSQPA